VGSNGGRITRVEPDMRRAVWLAVLGAVAYAQEPTPGRGVNVYSHAKEAALGAELAREALRSWTPLDSAPVSVWLNELGQRLAAQLPPGGFPFEFTAVRDDIGGATHEPAIFPGGYVFVPAGLLLEARSEAEFAGMLAHATAHVAERHQVRMAAQGARAEDASLPLVFVGGWTGDAGAMPRAIAARRQEFEIEADRLAVRMIAGAGYPAAALVAYLERLPVLPGRDERLAAIREAVAALPAPPAVAPLGGFATIQGGVRRYEPAAGRPAPSLEKH